MRCSRGNRNIGPVRAEEPVAIGELPNFWVVRKLSMQDYDQIVTSVEVVPDG